MMILQIYTVYIHLIFITVCYPTGRAPIEGVCIPDRECSVNRDAGLNTAFVLAHELGHK